MVQITVDLSSDKPTLVKVAEFILTFAGYSPAGAQNWGNAQLSPADKLIEDGKAITRADMAAGSRIAVEALGGETPSPETAFAAGVGGDVTVSAPLPPALVTHPLVPTPEVPPPPPPAGIDVDVRGLPWDPRIHASTRAKTQDGQWRQKRGVDPNLLTVVEAELRQTMGIAAPPAIPPAPPVPPAPVVPPVPFAGSATPPVPPVSGTPTVPGSAGAATTASPGNPAPTFPQLMQAITKGFTGGTITQPQIAAAVQKVGLPALPMLAARPDLVGAVATELGIAL